MASLVTGCTVTGCKVTGCKDKGKDKGKGKPMVTGCFFCRR